MEVDKGLERDGLKKEEGKESEDFRYIPGKNNTIFDREKKGNISYCLMKSM